VVELPGFQVLNEDAAFLNAFFKKTLLQYISFIAMNLSLHDYNLQQYSQFSIYCSLGSKFELIIYKTGKPLSVNVVAIPM
jgi:hypothetical protein